MATKHLAKTKRLERTYSAHEEQAGLEALAFYRGNGRAASRLLKKQGITIPNETLYAWKRDKAEQLAEIVATRTPQMLKQVMADNMDLLREETDLQRKYLTKQHGEVGELSPIETSTASRNSSVRAGILTDKILDISGTPQRPTEQRSADDLIKAMQRKGYAVVEGEAEEIVQSEA